VPLNRALGGSVNIADLPLGQIESIAIYRGFTPASLPASSIGGAILIETRHRTAERRERLRFVRIVRHGRGIAAWSGGSDGPPGAWRRHQG